MLVLDLPVDTPYSAPTVMVVQKQSAPLDSKQRTIGACKVIENIGGPSQDYIGSLSPAAVAINYLAQFEKEYKGMAPSKSGEILRSLETSATAVVVKNPAIGTVVPMLNDDGSVSTNSFRYIPNFGNMKKDYLSISVKIGAYDILIKYVLHPTNTGTEDELSDKICENGAVYPLASAERYILSSNSYQLPPYTFGTLNGQAVGQSVGEGANAQITLDFNAAGHGWFRDSTPDTNEDFLPTSNPTIWQAKAGSAADGKMDMLSVLLHEYGHTLSLDHSADSSDFMATTRRATRGGICSGFCSPQFNSELAASAGVVCASSY